MRIAAIDIGTNTVLLLIADVDEHGTIHPLEHQQRLPRLGRDVDQNRTINIGAFDKITWILNEYKNLAQQFKADRIIACGTSAIRDAANREEFLRYILSLTGIEIEVLSGEDEALWTFRGAVSGFPNLRLSAVVIDVGGGSTEVSYLGGNQDHLTRKSVQIGSVRLTERYFKHNPPTKEETAAATEAIADALRLFDPQDLMGRVLIGVAGTVTTLAALDQGLKEFDIEKVSGYRLHRERVEFWLQRLLSMTTAEIRSLSNTTEGRADILPAGVLILAEFMRRFQFNEILVSERGLRYGLVLREWERRE